MNEPKRRNPASTWLRGASGVDEVMDLLTALTRRLEALEGRVAELATSQRDLSTGHGELAAAASRHLAGLQIETERTIATLEKVDPSVDAKLLAVTRPIAQGLAALEQAVSDLEKGQTSIAATLGRHGPAGERH